MSYLDKLKSTKLWEATRLSKVIGGANKTQQVVPAKKPFIDWGIAGPLITLMFFTSSIFLINEQYLVSYMKEPYVQEIGVPIKVEFDLEFKNWARDIGIQRIQCSFKTKKVLSSYARVYKEQNGKDSFSKVSLITGNNEIANNDMLSMSVNFEKATNEFVGGVKKMVPMGLCPKEFGTDGFIWLARSDLNVWSLWATSSYKWNLERGSKDIDVLQNWIKSNLDLPLDWNLKKENPTKQKTTDLTKELESSNVGAKGSAHVVITNKSSPYMKVP